MTEMKCIAYDFDVLQLMSELSNNQDLWKEKTFRQDFEGSAHRSTETIYLRWSPRDTAEEIQGRTSSVDFPALSILKSATEIISKILSKISAKELGRAIIVRLKPGGEIIPHVDEGAYADHFERFHLVIQSEDSWFFTDSNDGVESAEMKKGELWWFNHKKTHSAQNKGSIPRIHMIVDAVAPEYRRERDH